MTSAALSASAPSIHLPTDPRLRYLLRLADTGLILAQRLGQWCGHAPILEEDIALANMALDLVGQSRALLTLAGQRCGQVSGTAFDEDQLAFLREERDYLNPTLVELPNWFGGPVINGRPDFASTVVRNTMVATWQLLMWERLTSSTDPELAAIAGQAVKESRYHQQHAGDWLVRLGDGNEESRRRMQAAVDALWRFHAELFEDDEVDAAAETCGMGPRASALYTPWLAEMQALMDEAGLTVPAPRSFRSNGRRGVHSEHMGYLLAEMQHLQRSHPGGAW